jgi:hypothetical protein
MLAGIPLYYFCIGVQDYWMRKRKGGKREVMLQRRAELSTWAGLRTLIEDTPTRFSPFQPLDCIVSIRRKTASYTARKER